MDRARIQLLQQMPIFGAIDDEAVQFLLDAVPSVHVPKGGFFFRERDPADSMYVLETGRVSVLKEWSGRELLLHRLEAGDCFGEMALLDLHPRSFRPGDCAQSNFARTQAIVALEDEAPLFHLFVRRSLAPYLAEWLLDAMREYHVGQKRDNVGHAG